MGLEEMCYLMAKLQYTTLGIVLGKEESFNGILEQFDVSRTTPNQRERVGNVDKKAWGEDPFMGDSPPKKQEHWAQILLDLRNQSGMSRVQQLGS